MAATPERTRRVVGAAAAVAATAVALRALRRRRVPAVTGDARWPPLSEPTPPPTRSGPVFEPQTWVAPVDGVCPAGHPLKANENSMIFHAPGGMSYDRTVPERCYAEAADAEADGFRAARR